MVIPFIDYLTALRASDLPGIPRAIAVWIASRCADGWHVTLRDIVDDSGYSRATVVRAIAELESTGWIIRESDKKRGNQYQIQIPCIENDTIGRGKSREVSRSTVSTQKAHSEPTEGSQRAVQKAHSEPTYIRTKQEQINKNKVPITTSEISEIRHKDFSMTDFYQLAQAIFRSKKMTSRVGVAWLSPGGQLKVESFATALYTDERIFEKYKGLLAEARESMTTRGV